VDKIHHKRLSAFCWSFMYREYKETLERQVTQVLNDRMPIQSEWKKTEFRRRRRRGRGHSDSYITIVTEEVRNGK